MTTKEELKTEIENVLNILLRANLFRNDSKYFTFRNSHYAPSELTPDYDSINKLLDISKDIVFELKSKIFDIHQVFDAPGKILRTTIFLSILKQKPNKQYRKTAQYFIA